MSKTKIIIDSKEFHSKLKALNPSSVVVLTDNNTSQFCLNIAQEQALRDIEFHQISIPAGESTKTLDSAKNLWDQIISLRLDRNMILVCLGGGMICDLGGYVASCYKRGVRTVYIPTTNLAMTDAAIGGKTGVNFGSAKNQIGTFHLPEFVLLDFRYLDTLSRPELVNGHAETIKHALIADAQLWDIIRTAAAPWENSEIINRSSNVKLRIIEGDLHDFGIRQSLNFGHTIGHAIETASHQTSSSLLHGQAILFGMTGETWLSHELQILSTKDFEEVLFYLKKFTDQITLPKMSISSIIAPMILDKKNSEGQIIFSLIEGIGSSKQAMSIDLDLISLALEFTLNSNTN
tara:strand:+ start:3325 stop:4368 length:1044 start_codon:yes stop_codon:yes gene_type:complete